MEVVLIQVQCAVPSQTVAKEIAKKLVEEQLAACVNVLPKMNSFYIYEDQFCEDEEFLLLIKTDQEHFKVVEKRILSLHPYDLPEIIALPITQASKDYLTWVKKALL